MPGTSSFGTGFPGSQDAELVALWVCEQNPWLLALTDVDFAGAESQHAFDLGPLIVGAESKCRRFLAAFESGTGQRESPPFGILSVLRSSALQIRVHLNNAGGSVGITRFLQIRTHVFPDYLDVRMALKLALGDLPVTGL